MCWCVVKKLLTHWLYRAASRLTGVTGADTLSGKCWDWTIAEPAGDLLNASVNLSYLAGKLSCTDSQWLQHFCDCFSSLLLVITFIPSVLWHCWLGTRKSIQPVKIEWWGGGVVICLERDGYCLQLMPKPHRLLPSLNPDWFYLSGTSIPRLSWKRGH